MVSHNREDSMEHYKNYFRIEQQRDDGSWKDIAHYTNRKIAEDMVNVLRDSTDEEPRRVIYVKEYSLDWLDDGIIL